MGRMSIDKRIQAEELLAEGWSDRAVADCLGVSRRAVGNLRRALEKIDPGRIDQARGARPPGNYGARPRTYPNGRRCAGCGAWINEEPCLTCQRRQDQAVRRAVRGAALDDHKPHPPADDDHLAQLQAEQWYHEQERRG